MDFLNKLVGSKITKVKNTHYKKINKIRIGDMDLKFVNLNNGYNMPALGLGTMNLVGIEGINTIKHAIDVGYRCFDTAYYYRNETEVGKAIQDKIDEGVIERKDVYVITKLWRIHQNPELVEHACRLSLKNLGLKYIDLYLIHSPFGYTYVDDKNLTPKDSKGNIMFCDVDYRDTWMAMEELVNEGLVKSIGLSNFNSEQVDQVLQVCTIRPVVNEIECSPAINQRPLIDFCKERNVQIIAFTPLGKPRPDERKPDFLYSDKVKYLGEKHKKTSAQIALRYLVDIGTIPIPKSANKNRIQENFDVFDFKLDADDIQIMDEFDAGIRMFEFKYAENHKFYPFN